MISSGYYKRLETFLVYLILKVRGFKGDNIGGKKKLGDAICKRAKIRELKKEKLIKL
ncbi:MAG: hypothetical protein LBF22_13215 [Deltaproteobacteria bacterium]|nr:hypothetical protein [Deltaproteobacteria bacterium]